MSGAAGILNLFFLAARVGIEPTSTRLEGVVLPLDERDV